MKKVFKAFLFFLVLLVCFRILLTRLLAPLLDHMLNRVVEKPPYSVSNEANTLHQQLFIADLHSDPHLWNRDLANQYHYGHLDVPRLRAGNVALQTVGVAAKIPWGLNFERNPGRSDMLASLAAVQNWPLRTWHSQYQRALYHAERLHDLIDQDPETLKLIQFAEDMEKLRTSRGQNQEVTGFLLGVEGVNILQGDLTRLDELYDIGFRLLGLTHFFDNEAGGSAHGWRKGGLTSFGRELIQAAEAKKMTIDLAHASPKLLADVCHLSTRPVIVSHTGVCGTCDTTRNLSDASIKMVADSGGLIGIAMFEMAVCGSSVMATAVAMRYTADLVGVDHVALGTDFDGAIKAPVDVTGLPLLTEALLTVGFSEEEIAKIMGGNAFRFLQENLPDK